MVWEGHSRQSDSSSKGRKIRKKERGGRKGQIPNSRLQQAEQQGRSRRPSHQGEEFELQALGWEPRRVLQQGVLCSEMGENRGAKK